MFYMARTPVNGFTTLAYIRDGDENIETITVPTEVWDKFARRYCGLCD